MGAVLVSRGGRSQGAGSLGKSWWEESGHHASPRRAVGNPACLLACRRGTRRGSAICIASSTAGEKEWSLPPAKRNAEKSVSRWVDQTRRERFSLRRTSRHLPT